MRGSLPSLLQGVWLGFSIAAPVGPIGMLVLRQSLRSGAIAGLASGLGAALADFLYGLLAVAGVRMAADYARPVGLVGALLLFWLAWKVWREKPATEAAAAPQGSRLAAATATTFLLTVSNPLTILSFAAMIAGLRPSVPVWFVSGVFLGSMLWWTLLSGAAAQLGPALAKRSFLLNRIAGLTLAAFGAWALWRALR